ncbi:protein regulator of cytokinesis 1-like [Drosophila tropicalis]|uniref:protein regulator of cytokinesis 1-like n=1 Tax=Drosophila tropicalis TaxID=46794 RepID=UPI0035AB8C03
MNTTTKSTILEETSAYVDLLQAIWNQMFEPTTCHEYLLRLKDHIILFFNDLINESEQKEQQILDEISRLSNITDDLNRQLNRKVVMDQRPSDMPLTMWQLNLDNSVENLKKDLSERRAEIFDLLLHQEQLCAELGELPRPLSTDPIATDDDLLAFRKHLEQMSDQRELLLNEIGQLRQQIHQDMKTLDLLASSENENRLLNAINHDPIPETLDSLQKLHETYKTQVDQMKNEIDVMFEKIQTLWICLGENVIDSFGRRQVEECKSNYNQRSFDILLEELQRCQNLRMQNLPSYMENLRVEFSKWCDVTLKSDQERMRFNILHNDSGNEDLLDVYELELEDVMNFYRKNKTIFNLFKRRVTLWTRMEALETKAHEPGRFNNRGGQLLKEERERKAIGVKLGKIEAELTKLVEDYMQRENVPFLVYGKNILERFAEDWEAKKKNRPEPVSKIPLTARATRTPTSMRKASRSTISLKKIAANTKLDTGSTGQLLNSGSSSNSVNDAEAVKTTRSNLLAKNSWKTQAKSTPKLHTSSDEDEYFRNENYGFRYGGSCKELNQHLNQRTFRMPLSLRQPKAKPSRPLENGDQKRCQRNPAEARGNPTWRP